MKIGITCTLKADTPVAHDLPDDAQEEYDSPATIEALAAVFRSLGHEAFLLGDGPSLPRRLLDTRPEFVFNIAEGHGISRSREARVPALLELLDIPYSGSDPLTLAVTLDKDAAKRLVQSPRVLVPRGVVLTNATSATDEVAELGLPYPVIVKPAWEGSSKGIRGNAVVEAPAQLTHVVEEGLRTQKQPVLVEEFIPGHELTVGVVGNDPPRVVGIMQVVPLQPTDRFVYSLDVKRDWERRVRYQCPPNLPSTALRHIEATAIEAYRRLGCRDVSRLDFRLGSQGLYFLEVNPLPGLNPVTSDLFILAKQAGWSYEQLITAILDAAFARQGLPRR